MEPGANIKNNLSARVSNARDTIKDIIEVFKGATGDVVERFNLDEQTEPTWGKQYMPGKGGEIGGLDETVIAIPLAMKNKLSKHIQKFASINRSWFK